MTEKTSLLFNFVTVSYFDVFIPCNPIAFSPFVVVNIASDHQ